jgi:hypothetical protein
MVINTAIQEIMVGFGSFLLAWMYGYTALKKCNLICSPRMTLVALLSLFGHAVGAFAFYYYTANIGSDSSYYFDGATTQYQGLGYWFVFFILGYAKKYLLGESLLNAFMVSGAISFVASIYYLLTYKILLDKITIKQAYPNNLLFYPALLLLCWPSYFFWSAGLVKDNFTFLSIGLIFYTIANGKFNLQSLLTLIIAFALGFFVRPYLFVIFSLSIYFYVLLSNQKFAIKIALSVSLILVTLLLIPLLNLYVKMMHFSGFTLFDFGKYAVQQQNYMQVGTAFPMFTHSAWLVFLFLPYFFLANIFLPLGFGMHGLFTTLSAIENAFLLGLIWFFLKNRPTWKKLKHELNIIYFYLVYFFIGMSCLSIMNTNMGVAMRQKMMYVPALLICIFLTYAYKKMPDQNRGHIIGNKF